MSMIHVPGDKVLDDSLDPKSQQTDLSLTVMQLFCNKLHT